MRFKKVIMSLLVLLSINCAQVSADQQTLRLSPAKVSDLHLDIGETKELEFNVGNRSTMSEGAKEEDFTFTVVPDFEIEDNFGNSIPTEEELVKFDNYNIVVKPNESIKSKVTVTLPTDLDEGYYKISLKYTKDAADGKASIRVPLYVAYGDEEKFKNLKSDFEINSLGVDDRSIKKLDLKLSTIISDLKTIFTEPAFQFDFKDKLYLSFKKDLEVLGIDCSYIKYTDDDLTSQVISIDFKDNIIINLDNGNSVEIPGTGSTLSKLKNNFHKIYETSQGNISLDSLLKSISVPRKSNWNYVNINTFSNIVNTEESNLTISSNSELRWNNTPVGLGVVENVTLRSENDIDLSIPLENLTTLNNGKYILSETVEGNNISKSKTREVVVDNLIIYKLMIIVITVVLILVLTVKRVKRKKNIEKEIKEYEEE